MQGEGKQRARQEDQQRARDAFLSQLLQATPASAGSGASSSSRAPTTPTTAAAASGPLVPPPPAAPGSATAASAAQPVVPPPVPKQYRAAETAEEEEWDDLVAGNDSDADADPATDSWSTAASIASTGTATTAGKSAGPAAAAAAAAGAGAADGMPSGAAEVPAAERAAVEVLKRQLLAWWGSEEGAAMKEKRGTLPIAALQAQLATVLAAQDVAVVSGDTGCGKTTQVGAWVLAIGASRGVS